MSRSALFAVGTLLLASCATPYSPTGLLGGFSVKELREDVYRVTFAGNGYTTNETAQAYWLYQCAELTLDKGYYGFEILSDMRFVMRRAPDDADPATGRASVGSLDGLDVPASPQEFAEAAAWRQAAAAARDDGVAPRIRLARGGGFVYVPMSSGSIRRPAFEGDIHMLKHPFPPAPPKMFAANALKTALDPVVKSEKCGFGNVCPHVHEYLLPAGKLQQN